jgi:GTP cyclohydrolase I
MQKGRKNSQQILEDTVESFLKKLGLNLSDPNLMDTPKRLVKMYQNEFLFNINKKPKNLITSFPNEKHYDEIIVMDNIPFTSLCSHHLLPFSGLAWWLYIPRDNLIGASKPARILEFFSKKPQLQENLASEVVNYFVQETNPLGVMLVMRATHHCMSCRGVKTGENAGMITSITYGLFRENIETRNEGLALIQLSVALRR